MTFIFLTENPRPLKKIFSKILRPLIFFIPRPWKCTLKNWLRYVLKKIILERPIPQVHWNFFLDPGQRDYLKKKNHFHKFFEKKYFLKKIQVKGIIWKKSFFNPGQRNYLKKIKNSTKEPHLLKKYPRSLKKYFLNIHVLRKNNF